MPDENDEIPYIPLNIEAVPIQVRQPPLVLCRHDWYPRPAVRNQDYSLPVQRAVSPRINEALDRLRLAGQESHRRLITNIEEMHRIFSHMENMGAETPVDGRVDVVVKPAESPDNEKPVGRINAMRGRNAG